MAKKTEIQYIHLYTEGSAARSAELAPARKKCRTKLPKPRKARKLLIRVDPIAGCGMVIACVMMLLMLVGIVQLGQAQREAQRVSRYLAQLEEQNAALQSEYESGYDLESIAEMALALGLVPEEQVRHVTVQLEEPQPEVQTGWWQRVTTFLTELFA